MMFSQSSSLWDPSTIVARINFEVWPVSTLTIGFLTKFKNQSGCFCAPPFEATNIGQFLNNIGDVSMTERFLFETLPIVVNFKTGIPKASQPLLPEVTLMRERCKILANFITESLGIHKQYHHDSTIKNLIITNVYCYFSTCKSISFWVLSK